MTQSVSSEQYEGRPTFTKKQTNNRTIMMPISPMQTISVTDNFLPNAANSSTCQSPLAKQSRYYPFSSCHSWRDNGHFEASSVNRTDKLRVTYTYEDDDDDCCLHLLRQLNKCKARLRRLVVVWSPTPMHVICAIIHTIRTLACKNKDAHMQIASVSAKPEKLL